MRHIYAVLCATFLLVAVGLPAVASEYQLAPDDVIEMNVWGERDLSNRQMQINSAGNITVPYINKVIHAAGLTQTELAELIRDEYMSLELLIDPKVDINIINRHKKQVSVLGQVQRPGVVDFKEGDTIMTAMAAAGSYSAEARIEAATLTRKDSKKPIPVDLKKLYNEGDMTQNLLLEEGDVLYVPEDTVNRYYVLGEVMRPGLYTLRDNMSVLSAVSVAGGASMRGSLKNVMLVRGDANNPEKRIIDMNKLIKGDLSQDVALEAGDVVYVAETSKPDWAKISQILNAISSVGVIRRYGLF